MKETRSSTRRSRSDGRRRRAIGRTGGSRNAGVATSIVAAGLKGLRFHDCRHIHASLLVRQGIHAKVISERLGHSGISITMDTYGHIMPNAQAEAVAGLDQMLRLAGRKR